jgi:hypothetical protein
MFDFGCSVISTDAAMIAPVPAASPAPPPPEDGRFELIQCQESPAFLIHYPGDIDEYRSRYGKQEGESKFFRENAPKS